jgi:TPR repeat protein
MYSTGEGVARDEVQAVKWFRKAAELGNQDAQYFLASQYMRGEGVAQSDVMAYMWCSQGLSARPSICSAGDRRYPRAQDES